MHISRSDRSERFGHGSELCARAQGALILRKWKLRRCVKMERIRSGWGRRTAEIFGQVVAVFAVFFDEGVEFGAFGDGFDVPVCKSNDAAFGLGSGVVENDSSKCLLFVRVEALAGSGEVKLKMVLDVFPDIDSGWRRQGYGRRTETRILHPNKTGTPNGRRWNSR